MKRPTITPLYILIGLVLAALFYAVTAKSEPLFHATAQEGVRIVLHSDKCSLDAVTNLPYKAVWEEKGKTFQGCWGPRPDMGVVVLYFDDKTVAAVPLQAFSRVQGA